MRNHPSSSMQMAELKIILSCCILQVRAKIKEVKTCTVVSWLQGTRYILKMKPQVCNAMDMNLCKLRASFEHTNLPSHHTHTYFTFTYTFKHQRRGVNIFHCCVLLCKSCKCAPKVYLTSPWGSLFSPAFTVRAETVWSFPGHLCLKCRALCSHLCCCTGSPAHRQDTECVISLKAPENPLETSPATLAGDETEPELWSHGQEPPDSAKNHYIIFQT